MFKPVRVRDVDLAQPLFDISGLDGYGRARLLIRVATAPVGFVELPLEGGRCAAEQVRHQAFEQYGLQIRDLLSGAELSESSAEGGAATRRPSGCPIPVAEGNQPLVTVAVCTRDRPEDLEICLKSLDALRYFPLDVIVVDNAPKNGSTRCLLERSYPHFRYALEPRPGLNWARNRAVLEARGEIVAFTDDDAVVDPEWVTAVVRVFREHSKVMVVTGPVIPLELETEAQVLFEARGGFCRGFERKFGSMQLLNHEGGAPHYDTGQFGTGANMAYRRSVFEGVGLFDPALDVGTLAEGAGDLEMFHRVIRNGFLLAYEPCALVRHRHRRDYPALRRQLRSWGVGRYSYLTRVFAAYPEERSRVVGFGLKHMWGIQICRWLRTFRRPSELPRELIFAELWGCVIGVFRYLQARKQAERVLAAFGAQQPQRKDPAP